LTRALGGYAHLARTPRLVLGTSVILVLAALLWRPRRRVDDSRNSDIVLFGGWGLGLIVLGVTGSMFDERYGLPPLAILPAAGALALHRLIVVRRPADLLR
jgi:multisubunit Na+/H+ antiporter MnhB subunit